MAMIGSDEDLDLEEGADMIGSVGVGPLAR